MSSTFEGPFNQAIEEYTQSAQTRFATPPPIPDADDGLGLRRLKATAKSVMDKAFDMKPAPFTFDFASIIEEKVAPIQQVYEANKMTAEQKYSKAAMERQQARKAQVDAAEQASAASTSNLEKSYDELLTYKDKIKAAVLRYDIKPSDISLDDENLTREEMEALVATAINSCKHLGDSSWRNHLAAIYTPPDDNQDTRLYQAFALIIGFILLAPIIFVGLFVFQCWNLAHIYKLVDGLRIADKLMFGINFQRFRDDPGLDAIPDVDLSDLDEARSREMEMAEKLNPNAVRDKLNTELTSMMSTFQSQIDTANKAATDAWQSWCAKWGEILRETTRLYDEFVSNRKDFCDTQSKSQAMNYKATVGLVDETVEVQQDVFSKNIIFANRDQMMVDFQKLLLANILLNVRPTALEVTIYDPERLGQDYSAFLVEGTKDYIHVETKSFDNILDAYRLYSQKNFATLDAMSILDYNVDAEAKQMVTLPYKLLFIATPDKNLYKNAAFIQFMATSVRSGVHVWMVGEEPMDGCTFYRTPFQGVDNPYPISPQLIAKAIKTHTSAKVKDTGILYGSSFQERYLPREKWWTYNTDAGIDLHLGLENGDPSKGYPITMSDMPVHGLCAGATGAGKSAFINQLLASLVTKYPPSALELILIDFKNAEFPVLKDNATQLSRIPHAKILAGTKDGEYVVSVFEYLLRDMEKRNEQFSPVGAKKLEEYNKIMRAQGTPEKCIPRTLLLIDEFQVMFTQVDPKILDRIQVLITNLAKLGRNAGVHMLFTSQSMAGTMSKDIKDQFSLRIALRCSADVSEELVGSKIASTITAKFGYMYSNTNAGAEQKSTKMWRSPFLPNEDWFDTTGREGLIAEGKREAGTLCILDELAQMVRERHEVDRKALFYDSKQRYGSDVLTTWYADHASVVEKNPGVVILGERTDFSTKTAPINFIFRRSDGENLVMYAAEDIDLCNIIRTLITSLKSDSRNIVLANSADDDYWRMCELESVVPPSMVELSRPNQDPTPWLDFLEDAIAGRKEKGMAGKKPLYFFAVRWDKQVNIYRGDSYRTAERWKSILQDGPSVDIHVILCCALYKDITNSHMVMFNHAICGQGDADAGYKFIESQKNAKLYDSEDSPIAVYKYGQNMQKFKLYQFEYTSEFSKQELDM